MKLKPTLTIVLLLIAFASQAQRWNQRRYEFYYGIGVSNFMGDVAAPSNASKLVWAHFFNTMGAVVNTGLRYNLQDRHYVRASLFLGQLYSEDPINNPKFYYRNGLKFSSFFTELAVKYEFMIIKERNRSTVYRQLGESKLKNFTIPTYLFIGIGGTFNTGKLSYSDELVIKTERFSNIAPVIPIGIGVKFRATRLTYINVEIGHRFTFSDGIDNCKGKENPAYGKYYDQYQFVTLNVIHKLKSNKKGLPKFKK